MQSSARTGARRSSASSSNYGSDVSTVTMEDFSKIKVVGRGAYGKVYLVKHNYTDKIFAMKAVKKELVIKTDQLDGIKCKYQLFLGKNLTIFYRFRRARNHGKVQASIHYEALVCIPGRCTSLPHHGVY